jgi:hypothetical protein
MCVCVCVCVYVRVHMSTRHVSREREREDRKDGEIAWEGRERKGERVERAS